MTKIDFNLIIIESFAHDHRRHFFKSMKKRIHRDLQYSKKGFLEGVDESFTWLNTEVNRINRLCCQVTLPDGSTREEDLSPHPRTLKKQLDALYLEGAVNYPFRKNIEVRSKKDNRFVFMLTAENMAALWPDLLDFLMPWHPVGQHISAPPRLGKDEPEFPWDNIIHIPEEIANEFFSFQHIPAAQKVNAAETEEVEPAKAAQPTMKEVALKFALEGRPITRENKDAIARSYGFKSGNKLYQDYCGFTKRSDRIADPDGSTKMMAHKIKLFENASRIVDPEYNEKALEELGILRTIFNEIYG